MHENDKNLWHVGTGVTFSMKFILSTCLAAAFVVVGCSKKEEASAPPSVQPPPVAPAPSSASVQTTEPKTPSSPLNSTTAPKTNAASDSASKALTPAQNSAKPASDRPVVAPTIVDAPITGTQHPQSLADLSTEQLTRGLKEALGKGLQQAIASLGKPGGFLTNLNVKIPMPEKMQAVEKALRTLGQEQLADEFITTMNKAAEQAVPAAADVFVGGLKNMTLDDAKMILSGPKDAATQYFHRTTGAELNQKFLPIVQQATAKSGATAAYKQLTEKAKLAGPFLSIPYLDLDAYVTGKAMDGLFTMVAEEEKRIRENPVARSTDLLKSVFGAFQK